MASSVDSAQEQAQQNSCTAVATTFTIISVFIVALRIYVRTFIVRNFGRDDWMMLNALIFTVAYLIAIYILRGNGMGYSGANLTPDQMVGLIKTTLAIQIIYYILIFSIKVSILLFYLRLASREKRFKRGCKVTIGVLTIFVTICVTCCIVQCIPLHKMWDFTGKVVGNCINTTALFYFTSSFNIVTDIWIIALPIRTLLAIQRPNREKYALIFVFSLGVFSCIASIVRLHAIRIYTESTDPFYDSVPINLWSMIEVNIGIWCASIPSLKAFITQRQRGRTKNGFAYTYHSRDKSGVKNSGNSGSTQAHDAIRSEAYGMGYITDPLPQPEQVAGENFVVDSEQSNGAELRHTHKLEEKV